MNHNSLPDEHEITVAAINHQGAESVRQAAEILRPQIIDTAFAGLLAYLSQQQEVLRTLIDKEKLNMSPFERTVMLTYSALPFDGDDPKLALSLQLEPDASLRQDRRGAEKLKVYFPVDDELILDENFDPNELERPSFIVVERFNPEGEFRSYIVGDDKVEEFQNPYYNNKEQYVGDEFIARNMSDFAPLRVNPLDAIVPHIMTELTNWTIQPQIIDIPPSQQ